MSRYFLSSTSPFEKKENGSLTSVSSYSFLYFQPEDETGFIFDTGLSETPAIYPHTRNPWLDGEKRATGRLQAIKSGLDLILERFQIPGLHFRFNLLLDTDTQPLKRKFVYSLTYQKRPVMVSKEIEEKFNEALSFNYLSVLRAEDFSENIPTWYSKPLFEEMSEISWKVSSPLITKEVHLQLYQDSFQTILLLPLDNDSESLLPSLIEQCRQYLSLSIQNGVLPKNIPSFYRALKTIHSPSPLLLSERISFPIFSTTAANKILSLLSELPTWDWIQTELSLLPVEDWYSLDYISAYLPDLLRVNDMKKYATEEEKVEEKLLLPPRSERKKEDLTLSRRLLADGRPELLQYLPQRKREDPQIKIANTERPV